MRDFFSFAVSFFSGWSQVAGLFTLVLAGVTLMQRIKLMYIPQGMQDIDDFVVDGGVAIITVCSIGFFLIKRESSRTPVSTESPSSPRN